MLRNRITRVTAQLADMDMRADYCEKTGCLRVLQEGVVVREWLPPNSWMAIASVAGARNWGTRPDTGELRALLENQISPEHMG